jgi:hypothetical protein
MRRHLVEAPCHAHGADHPVRQPESEGTVLEPPPPGARFMSLTAQDPLLDVLSTAQRGARDAGLSWVHTILACEEAGP